MRPCRERALFGLAGSFTLLSVLGAMLVSPWFLIMAALVAANQLLFAATGSCPAAFLLGRAGVRPCHIQGDNS